MSETLAPSPSLRVLTILVVDDDPDYVRIISMLLERQITTRVPGVIIKVISAGTLADGIAVAEMANCTILDLGLPDSRDPLETVKSINRFRPPVIVITGTDDPAILDACTLNGAATTFVKGQMHGLSDWVLECLMHDVALTSSDSHASTH